jgi:hypothetical protein
MTERPDHDLRVLDSIKPRHRPEEEIVDVGLNPEATNADQGAT